MSSSLVFGLVAPAALAGSACPPDSARVGTACVDRYEASIWRIPVSNKGLLKKVQQGKATVDDLENGGATLVRFYGGTPGDPPDYATNFPGSGDWVPVAGSNPPSPGFYALSLPGVQPALATWYQAQQACALAGKRLLTHEEWQRAAAGTPDPGPNAVNPDPQSCKHFFDWPPYDTGSRPKCVSRWGVYDMVGNFGEWVADPGQRLGLQRLEPAGDASARERHRRGAHTRPALSGGGQRGRHRVPLRALSPAQRRQTRG